MSVSLQPVPGRVFPALDTKTNPSVDGRLELSAVVLGGGVFGYDYNTADTLESDVPEQTLRLCLRYGITTVDTSPYYSTSEAVIGKAFAAIADEFPRSSYQIITKAGRYGRTRETGFDYSPAKIRSSIANSLALLGTTYLDGVYMHDVEFVSERIGGVGAAGFVVGRDEQIAAGDLAKWGLAPGDEGVVRGPGDQTVLDAMRTLFELKQEGVIRAVGFSGYPLPTLLRLARLVAFHLEPLDIMQSYCHHTLQNTTLSTFLPLFHAAGVKQVITASPLNMGLLRGIGGQPWHPASAELKTATEAAARKVQELGSTIETVSLGFGLAGVALDPTLGSTPTVVGLSTPQEVHETMKVYVDLYHGKESRAGRRPGTGLSAASAQQLLLEKTVVDYFRESGTYNQLWSSGLPAV